jgi:hypothetical protein
LRFTAVSKAAKPAATIRKAPGPPITSVR